MISRGEVGLIVTAMGASTGIFGRPEVALMVAVVLLTTLLTPVALRGAFHLKSPQDVEEGLAPPPTKERARRLEVDTPGML
jgi:Kef-type K+ transport system membrane component KefB